MHRFKTTEYFVEANPFEQQVLWERFSEDNDSLHSNTRRVTWEQDGAGIHKCVGSIGKIHPIVVTVFFVLLDKHRIAFYYSHSELVHYPTIEKWLKVQCAAPKTDAQNFHQVIRHVWENEPQYTLEMLMERTPA